MADLNSLFRVAPGMAAMFTGQTQQSDMANDSTKRRELEQLISARQQEAEQNQQMNPLKIEQQRLLNQRSTAEMPGYEADAQAKVLKTKAAGETYDSDVAASKAENQGKVDKELFDKAERASKALYSAIPELENLPAAAQHGRLRTVLKDHGVKDDAIEKYMQIPPDQLIATLSKQAERAGALAARQNTGYRQATEVEASHRASAEKIAAGNNATSVQVANIGAQSRRDAATAKVNAKATTIQQAVLSGKLKLTEAPMAFEMAAQQETDPDAKELLMRQARQAEELVKQKAAAGQTGKPDVAAIAGLPGREQAPVYGGESPTPSKAASGGRIRVVRPDGKIGTIPADQLQTAMQQGFKKAP